MTTTPFRPIGRRRAFEDVILQVEDAIAEGRITQGDRLPPERELAQTLGVSRGSVREALRVLEAFGVLAARRGRGADAGSTVTAEHNGLAGLLRIYASLLKVPLSDLVDLRVAIETMTARAAAARRDAPPVTDAPDRDAFLQADTEFHVALARASGNVLAPLLMEALREAIARQMRAAFVAVEDWDATRARILADHEEIAERVRQGDGEGAADAVERHVRGFYELFEGGDG
jgi:GntR family transcriptional regulator, transcriptional repressor for pyruvate dehydrogenase complex